jgi:hypothetical protein
MNTLLGRDPVYRILEPVFLPYVHKKRVLALSLATVGVCHTGRLSVAEAGRSLAAVTGKSPKHCIKQIDRFLGSDGLELVEVFPPYVRMVVGDRKELFVAMDWTDYAVNEQATVMLSVVTTQGRATPLVWKTVSKRGLKGKRNGYEDDVLHQLRNILGPDVKVTVLGDRAFGDVELYEMLQKSLGWDFIIRFRGVIEVVDREGEVRRASEWVPKDGTALRVERPFVTQDRVEVPAVVCVRRPKMKDDWCLATSRTDLDADAVASWYGRRFTIEESFRDEKDDRFGWGLRETDIEDPAKRDRLLFVVALARVLLTMLGAAGEELGLDIRLRANTVKKRTHALLTQGRQYVYGVGVLAAFALPLAEVFHGLIHRVHLLEFIGGAI